MEYTTEVLNRQTGDLETQSLGDWITITELGERYRIGPRQTRAVLKQMGILDTRYTGQGRVHRHVLTDEAIEAGLGKHVIPRKKGQTPFDVLSPKGQQWIADRWSDTVSKADKAKNDNPVISEATHRLEAFKTIRATPPDTTDGSVLVTRPLSRHHTDGHISGPVNAETDGFPLGEAQGRS